MGYHAQRVTGADGVPVESGGSYCGYNAAECKAKMEAASGLSLSTFVGKYTGLLFVFNADNVEGCPVPPAPATTTTANPPQQTTTTSQVATPTTAPGEPSCVAGAIGPAIVDAREFKNFEVPSAQTTGLIAIGMYESLLNRGFRDHREGNVEVNLNMPGEFVLAAASYETSHYTINVGENTVLKAVHAYGYHPQRVTVVGAKNEPTIKTRSYEENGSNGPFYGLALGEQRTTEFITAAEQETGLKVSTYAAKYSAQKFDFNSNDQGCVSSDETTTQVAEPTEQPTETQAPTTDAVSDEPSQEDAGQPEEEAEKEGESEGLLERGADGVDAIDVDGKAGDSVFGVDSAATLAPSALMLLAAFLL